MPKTTKKTAQPLLDDKYRLHVDLSRNGAKALAAIRRFKVWNKKTAVDTALEYYASKGMNGGTK